MLIIEICHDTFIYDTIYAIDYSFKVKNIYIYKILKQN